MAKTVFSGVGIIAFELRRRHLDVLASGKVNSNLFIRYDKWLARTRAPIGPWTVVGAQEFGAAARSSSVTWDPETRVRVKNLPVDMVVGRHRYLDNRAGRFRVIGAKCLEHCRRPSRHVCAPLAFKLPYFQLRKHLAHGSSSQRTIKLPCSSESNAHPYVEYRLFSSSLFPTFRLQVYIEWSPYTSTIPPVSEFSRVRPTQLIGADGTR